MSIKDKFKNWPEEKKKLFSLFTAGVLTLGIVISWFSFNPIFVASNEGYNVPKDNTNYLSDTLNKISEQYNSVKSQIENLSGTTSTSSNNSSSSIESSTSTKK
jgi:hypothetical protein